VKLHDLLGNRQAEAAGLTRRGGVLLTEALEDVRQEGLADPVAVVLHLHLQFPVRAMDVDLDPAALRRELDGVVDQVPENLLQTAGIRNHLVGRLFHRGDQLHALGVGGRLQTLHGGLENCREKVRLASSPWNC
jgi:hypothetical protein